MLGWVVRTEEGDDAAWKHPGGELTGKLDGTYSGRYAVHILKRHTEEV